MFERLTEGLTGALSALGGRADDSTRHAFIETIRDRLLDADAHPDVVGDLIERLENRLSRPDDEGRPASERFLTGLEEEIARILGGQAEPLRLRSSGTSAVMVVGLQGTGKTTSVGKLAQHLRTQKKNVMLVPLDVKRPAAIEQLQILGRDLDIPVWDTDARQKPVKVARAALKAAEKQKVDVVIFDTAGRLAIDQELMRELTQLRDKLRPQEILYVMDAMAGQTAVQTAERFVEAVRPSGMILTKVDADPRGGAVLSVRARTGIPVKFMGVGEKASDFEPFDPTRIARRLLDLGDIESLAEKFDEAIDREEAEELSEKFLSAKFNLEDFGRQLEMMSNLGSLESIFKMMPGGKQLLKQVRDLSVAESEMKRTRAMISSMTPLERRNPRILNNSRKKRIAMGSGTSIGEVNRMLKRFQTMQKLMKRISRSPMAALQNMLGGQMPGGIDPRMLRR
ncbi:MAG: signal recognition particle protein [Candidatus Dadabacteria bacterium]|nr:MAG: signal recognition particle protein [Candidatus Dadabacteria bacterium]